MNLGVGSLYAGVTRYCFDLFEDESGKVMALAAYGRERADGDSLPVFRDGETLMSPDFKWTERFQNPANFDHHREEYESLCASAQAALERVVIAQCLALHARTGSKNLCFAGGIALNCVANKKILEETGFENLFVQPAAHDGGITLGCAKYGWHKVLGHAERVPMQHAFLGKAYNVHTIERALKSVIPCSRAGECPTPRVRPPGASPTGSSSGGTRAAASSVRARWATAASWPTRGDGTRPRC